VNRSREGEEEGGGESEMERVSSEGRDMPCGRDREFGLR